MKSSTSCRRCSRWLEGEWNGSKDEAEKAELERQMAQGLCDDCAEALRPAVERMELQRMCGKLLKPIEMLQRRRDANRAEGLPAAELDLRIKELTEVRNRLRAIADSLPEGPLEAFGREHPMFHDPIDGPYCGYRNAEGKPHTCPVRDPAKHWDAWELRGTTERRPVSAGGEARW